MIIIGEKINGTIPSAKKILEQRDESKLIDLAQSQARKGADYIDVNVGTGNASPEEERSSMKWAVNLVQEHTDKGICVDSPDPAVLRAGLEEIDIKRAMINSTTAETERLEAVIPIAAEYEAPLIALAMDDTGIPATVEGRIRACETIEEACEKAGIAMQRLLFDPLVLPISTDASQGVVTLNTIKEIKERFPQGKTVAGLTNISFGLPAREQICCTFLQMAILSGLDAAIMNPLCGKTITAVRSAEAVLGRDRHFRRYMRLFRKKTGSQI